MSEDLRSRMALEYIVMRRGRLRWFRHVERMGKGSGVRSVKEVV